MIWFAVTLLALLGFALAIGLLGLPRSAQALLGTALMLGLAGYAWQGSPDIAGAPASTRVAGPQNNEVLVAARRAMFGGDVPPARYVAVADGFALKGQTEDAAGFLRVALSENPRNAEAWVALGNVLVAHARGSLTPPATEAFARAARLAPASPAPAYFEGLALLQTGRVPEAREAWTRALTLVPADAAYRPIIAGQLAQLDHAIATADTQADGRLPARQP